MMFRGHLRVGILTYFIAVVPVIGWVLYREGSVAGVFQQWWEILICFALCVLGAMVPDTDIKSKSQRVIYALLVPVDLFLILFRYYEEAALLGFFAILPNILKHRGQLHTRSAAIILPLPLLIIPIVATGKMEYQQLGVSYYVAAVFGFISHLVADRKVGDSRKERKS